MHQTRREAEILQALKPTGFVTYRELEARIDGSPATIRRDLDRLERQGMLVRVHGGAKLPDVDAKSFVPRLAGIPFAQSISENLAAKRAIGKAAAKLCLPGEGIMIDGGTTTLQMCPHLEGLDLQVLTNSLHIVDALLPQSGTRVLVPSGTVFREQNIILAAAGEESMPRFHAPKLFMGAAAIGPQGVMQADVVLVAAERRLIDRAEEVILLIDSSKFSRQSGTIVCGLEEVDVVITDIAIPEEALRIMQDQAIETIVVDPET
jgi:DeoR family ulaG and ulaABCDEF operon transcriptional repressor